MRATFGAALATKNSDGNDVVEAGTRVANPEVRVHVRVNGKMKEQVLEVERGQEVVGFQRGGQVGNGG